MKNPEKVIATSTHIVVLLDKSGSMRKIHSDVIGSFNQFVDEQKKLADDKCTLTLVQFDSQDYQEVTYDSKPIGEVPELTEATFMPRSMTPLLDAIGVCVVNTDAKIKKMKKAKRPQKVIFVIITDGQENDSKEYTREKAFDLIKSKEKDNDWLFMFLAANQDAIAEAGNIGIQGKHSITYSHDGKGTRKVMSSMSRVVSEYRSTGDTLGFMEQERNESNDVKGSGTTS